MQVVSGGTSGVIDGGNKVIDGAGHAVHGALTWFWDTLTGDKKDADAAAKEFNNGISEAKSGTQEIHDGIWGGNSGGNQKPNTGGNNSGSNF